MKRPCSRRDPGTLVLTSWVKEEKRQQIPASKLLGSEAQKVEVGVVASLKKKKKKKLS